MKTERFGHHRKITRRLVWLAWLILMLPGPVTVLAQQSGPSAPDQLTAAAAAAADRGDYEQAIQLWQQLEQTYRSSGDASLRVGLLLKTAAAYRAIGHQRRALQDLQTAAELAADQPALLAAVDSELGQLYFQTGNWQQAGQHFAASADAARTLGDRRLQAAVLNDQGTLAGAQGDYQNALGYFQSSLPLARSINDATLVAKILINTARVRLMLQDYDAAAALLSEALAVIDHLPASADKARSLISAGKLWQALANQHPPLAQQALTTAVTSIRTAAELADSLGDQRSAAYAWGYLGQIYEEQQRYAEALQLTERAGFAAQQGNAPESLYRWQWQSARLLRAQNDIDGAIAAYQRAVATLQAIRQDLTTATAGSADAATFKDSVGQIFFELADLLLQRAPQITDQSQRQRYLLAAQDTVEQLKSAELTDYFRDDCVTALQARTTRLDRIESDTAIIYPILLADRIELLVSLAEGISQVTVPVDNQTLTRTVREFRQRLEAFDTDNYLPYAQQLYSWLIAPLEPLLAGHSITTLVFVPDGPLRTIPMAALHDGNQFVISRYAVATTPGLTLTDFRRGELQSARLLLSGLTEAVQGFEALPNVAVELRSIQDIYGGTMLLNEDYLLNRVREELADNVYSIVHIASHGQFAGDVNNTFVLTYDDKLTMNRLEQFMGLSQYRNQPIELLTLSACQTATGDDRAALGLAGIAVKAGARSALASLWFIEDRSTARLISEFYRELKNPALSKAQALQQAQLTLINEPEDDYQRHPSYWGPFLLIGNWL